MTSIHFSSKSNEWLTPPEIIERVIEVMGFINLDPCSNSKAIPNIPAHNHFTIETDGLSLPWYDRVYINPPYGRGVGKWVEKLCSEYKNGNVSEAIALVPARTDTHWFRRLKKYSRCFVWGRLKFSGHKNSAPFPSMVVYLGKNIRTFTIKFKDMGDIYQLREMF